jgi:3-methyladenine DNA glycosylase AlkD
VPTSKRATPKKAAPKKAAPKKTAPKKAAPKRASPEGAPGSVQDRIDAAVEWLRRTGTKATRDGMARYAIPSDRAFGVTMGQLRAYAKRVGRDHELALGLWSTGWYEARMLATLVDDPAELTPAQMERWCRDFDSWAICDTACFALFDRSPHAWAKVAEWAGRRDEFQKRGAFALLASLALHDKQSGDEVFESNLPSIEGAATDGRNFVKKSVSWALRAIGRRSVALNAPAVALARQLSTSKDPASRWVGKDALRELTSPAVAQRLAAKASKKPRAR